MIPSRPISFSAQVCSAPGEELHVASPLLVSGDPAAVEIASSLLQWQVQQGLLPEDQVVSGVEGKDLEISIAQKKKKILLSSQHQ